MYFEDICPYVRKAGIENFKDLRSRISRTRRIYDHEFIFGTKGITTIVIKDREYNIGENDMILIKPNVPHYFKTNGTVDTSISWVHFDFKQYFDSDNIDYTKEYDDSLYGKPLKVNSLIRKDPIFENNFVFPEFLKLDEIPDVKNIFDKLVKCFLEPKMFWQMESRYLLIQLLHIALKQCFKNLPYYINPHNLKISAFMQDYVYKNIRGKLTLKNLSDILGYNDEYLGKVFIKETGESFTDYVNKARLKQSIQLLKNHSLSLADIAELCGFCDSFYYSKVMKKYMDISPSKLRTK